METKKIVLTGGHAGTTAIATIQELKKSSDFNWRIYWIGPQKAVEGTNVETLEYKIFPSLGVKFYPIVMGRVQRRWSRYTIPSLVKVPIGFFHALILLLKLKPHIVVSFGGFAGFPVVFMSSILRIPSLIHEQTVATGLANKLSSYFAKKIAIARKDSAKFFPKEQVVLTGNPIMTQISSLPPKTKIGSPPTLYISGGSRGSQIINGLVGEALEQLLAEFSVIHQTGDLDFELFQQRKQNLAADLKEKYEVINFVDPMKLGDVYKKADIFLGRSGANTVAELITIGIPSVLIPIPWARYNEQVKNAELAQKAGIAIILEQDNATPEALLEKLHLLKNNWKRFTHIDDEIRLLDRNASKRLCELIASTLN